MQLSNELVNLYNTIVCAGVMRLPDVLEKELKELEKVGLISIEKDGEWLKVQIRGWDDK